MRWSRQGVSVKGEGRVSTRHMRERDGAISDGACTDKPTSLHSDACLWQYSMVERLIQLHGASKDACIAQGARMPIGLSLFLPVKQRHRWRVARQRPPAAAAETRRSRPQGTCPPEQWRCRSGRAARLQVRRPSVGPSGAPAAAAAPALACTSIKPSVRRHQCRCKPCNHQLHACWRMQAEQRSHIILVSAGPESEAVRA